MTFIDKCSDSISVKVGLNNTEQEIMKYGLKVLYINISKTVIFLGCIIALGILKEAAILFASYLCVRVSGFGVHSDNTIKCTVIGLIQFIGGTYIAIICEPFNVLISVTLYLMTIIIFAKYAPIETLKRPISQKKKKIFKRAALLTATGLFITALFLGESIYRNLILIGFLLEAVTMLPSVKKIIL